MSLGALAASLFLLVALASPATAAVPKMETPGSTAATLLITCDRRIASPESFILPDPPRLVLDIPDAFCVPQQPIQLPKGGPILKVQASQYREQPVRIARVVVDLASLLPYHVVMTGNQLKVAVGAIAGRPTEAPRLAKRPIDIPKPVAPEPLPPEAPRAAAVPKATVPVPAPVLVPPAQEAARPAEPPRLAKPPTDIPTPVAPEPLAVEAPETAEAPRGEAKRPRPPEEGGTKFEFHPLRVAGHTLLNVPVRSLVELRFKNVVRQAYDISCGAAAMATLLKYYYGEEVTEREAIAAMLELGDKEKIQKEGFSLLEMKRFAERRGYVAGGYRITDVDKLTNLKVPAITLISVRGYSHFVVVKGVAGGQVFIADPAFGNRSRSLESFGGEWNNAILVVLSDSRPPTSAFTLDPMLKAPARDVMVIVDRGLRTIAPGAGEF